jgi:signal transduction histidine kinase
MRESDNIIMSVGDNGIGFAPEMLPHIFDLFWQSQQASHRSGGGLGLGLALVRRIVTLHGGSVRLRARVPVTVASSLFVCPVHRQAKKRGQAPLPERPFGCFAQRCLTPFFSPAAKSTVA